MSYVERLNIFVPIQIATVLTFGFRMCVLKINQPQCWHGSNLLASCSTLENLLITNLTHSFKHTCTFHAFKWGSEFKSNKIVSNLQSSQLNTKQNEQNEQMLHF